MKKLKSAFKDYLKKVGVDEFIPFGEEDHERYPTEESSLFFEKQLLQIRKVNDRIINIAIIMLCILFGVGVFFMFRYRNDSTAMSVILGNNFLFFFLILVKLRQFWIEKYIIDSSLIVLHRLKPEEAAKFIVLLYSKFISKKIKVNA